MGFIFGFARLYFNVDLVFCGEIIMSDIFLPRVHTTNYMEPTNDNDSINPLRPFHINPLDPTQDKINILNPQDISSRILTVTKAICLF